MRIPGVAVVFAALVVGAQSVSAQVAQHLAKGPPKTSEPSGGLLDLPARLVIERFELKRALKELRRTSGVPIAFSDNLLPINELRSCDCDDVSVGRTLDRLLEGTSLQYVVVETQVLIEPSPPRPMIEHRAWVDVAYASLRPQMKVSGVPHVAFSRAQARQVSGRVMDAATEAPVVGALVDAGGLVQATTDQVGSFTITVAAGEIRLRVRAIGFRSQQIPVTSAAGPVVVRLVRDIFKLDELVVSGTATSVSRQNLANSVATVTAEELNAVPAGTIEQQLQGKVAGAAIRANSGAPGGGVQVQIRGLSSINAKAQPLWVVDGVIVSDIDLETGAFVVKSAAGENQDNNVNRIADLNPNDIERVEVLKGASAAAIYGSKAGNGVILVTTKRGRPGKPRVEMSQKFGISSLAKTYDQRTFQSADEAVALYGEVAREHFVAGQRFDFIEQLAGRRDLSYETTGTLSGGNETTRYFASGLIKKDAGIIDNTGYQKQSFRLNVGQLVGSRVDFDLTANVIHSLAQRGLTGDENTGAGVPYQFAVAFTPSFFDLRRRPDGTYPINPFIGSNPLETAALSEVDEDVWRAITSGQLRIEAFNRGAHRLQLIIRGGVDYFQQQDRIITPPELQFEPLDGLPGTSVKGNAQSRNLTASANVVHTFRPGSGRFTATTSAGFQYESTDLDIVRVTARGLIAGQTNVNAGTQTGIFETRERVNDQGVYLQEEFLTLSERLFLTLGARADRSSNNGDPTKFSFYPKASASYNFGKVGFADGLKVRLAYGASGNQPLFGRKFTPLTAVTVDGKPGTVIAGRAGDINIRPERQRELEAGFDATLFRERAKVELTLYQRNITDLLLQRRLGPSGGFTLQDFNGGELRVRGVEASLGITPATGAGFNWLFNAIFSANRSLIVELPVPTFRRGGFGNTFGVFQIEQGKSPTQFLAPDGPATGPVEIRLIGDANPDFRMSFVNDLTVRRTRLYFLWDWQQGGIVSNLTQWVYDIASNNADFDTDQGERAAGSGRFMRPYMEDATFLKLREVSISHELPAGVTSRLWGQLRGARLSVTGRNLLTFTGYSGYDPETSMSGRQQLDNNYELFPYPPMRSIWFAIDLSF